jgi:hypothetical protein
MRKYAVIYQQCWKNLSARSSKTEPNTNENYLEEERYRQCIRNECRLFKMANRLGFEVIGKYYYKDYRHLVRGTKHKTTPGKVQRHPKRKPEDINV